jgi:hypothetical protein
MLHSTRGEKMEEITTPKEITPLEARQAEVAQYEANIAIYKKMLVGLPTEWPTHLQQYRGATDRHKVIGEIANLDDVQLLADLWTADDCVKAIRTETLEKRKSEAVLAALQV